MQVWKLLSIFNKKNRFLSLSEIYEEFINLYDVSHYTDYKAAIRTELYRNCIDRDLKNKGKKLFVSLKFKGEKGQSYGLYDWIKQDSDKNTESFLKAIKNSPKIIFLKETSKILRDESVKKLALQRAQHLCEFDKNHKSFLRKSDGNNYMEIHHLIPLELQFDDKYKNINLDCIENVCSLCSNCHNQIHYGLNNSELLYKLYLLKKDGLSQKGIIISYEELKGYYE